jgi:hypothetical protein
MAMLRLKMAAFLVMLSVAPAAAANQPGAGAKHDRSACTHGRARAGVGAPAVAVTPPRKLTVRTVIVKGGGGGINTWGHIAADLMP